MKRSTFDFIRSSGLSLAMWSTSPKWLTKRVWGGDTTPVFVSVSDTRVANMLCLEPELLPSSFLSSETMEAKTSVTRGKRNLFKEKEPHGGSLTDEAKLGNSSQTDQPMSASRSVGSPPLVTRPTSPPPRCSSAPGDGRDDGAQRNSWWQVDLFRHGSFMVQMWFQTVG